MTIGRIHARSSPNLCRALLALAAAVAMARPAGAGTDGILLDGFDVDLGKAYFVGGGSDLGPGTAAQPFATITKGIAAAAADAVKKNVVVAAGEYPESVALADGVNLYGEYTPGSFVRAAGNYTILDGVALSGVHAHAVLAAGIGAATVFDRFVVFGPANVEPGGNSYAIYVSGVNANLQITNNRIFAGHGGPGTDGAAGPDGLAGIDGGGRNADAGVADPGYDAFAATATGECNTTNNRQLANGGALTCGATSVSGGNGGGNRCPVMSYCDLWDPSYGCLTNASNFHWIKYSALDGAAGSGAGAGAGGTGGDDMIQIYANFANGYVCYVPPDSTSGLAGANGSNGADGAGVAGCTQAIGHLDGGDWSAGAAPDGEPGAYGSGGGGGGAGGGGKCENDGKGNSACSDGTGKDTLGAHGGGGGSGGCGGSGGGGGGSGGGAFGIFIAGGAAPVVTGNLLAEGTGGRGGNGGNGGARGLGGSGGHAGSAGVPVVFCSDVAGAGGAGGNGGFGSGGGGGCGGGSFGIYASGVGTPNYCDAAAGNTFASGAAGAGGSGGLSQANPGGDGAGGLLADCSVH